MSYKYLDKEGLSYYHQKVKALFSKLASSGKEYIVNSAGWYRVAEFECDTEAEARGSTSNSCEIIIRRGLGDQEPEFHHLRLMSDYGASSFSEIASISASSDAHLITKIRHTVDDSSTVSYLEIYYASDDMNPIRVSLRVDDSNDTRWKVIEPYIVPENIFQTEVYSVCDISENSLSMQDFLDKCVVISGEEEETDIPDELVKYVMGSDMADTIAPLYDNTLTYVVGDYCTYDNKLYQCVTAISTPEDFNLNNWKKTSFAKELLTFAKKAIYDDTTINLSRKEGSPIGAHSISLGAKNINAAGDYSFVTGNDNTGLEGQSVFGHYNNTTTAIENSIEGVSAGSAFVIGNGTASQKSNAFRVTGQGATVAKQAYSTTGADYAEFYEWEDGNPDNEDRRGLFVTSVNNKIRIANANDSYILGVVSALPSVIGNYDEEWMGRYILDEFGAFVTETFEYTVDVVDPITGERSVVTKTGIRWKENPEYDSSKEYIPREQRPEWGLVGLIGTICVIDDGSCEVNGYCKCSDNGIAVSSTSGYRVIQRVSENIIKVIIKGDGINQISDDLDFGDLDN